MSKEEVYQEEAPGIQSNDPNRVAEGDDAIVGASELHAQGGGAGGGTQHLRGDGADDGKTQPRIRCADQVHKGHHDSEHGHTGADGADGTGFHSGADIVLGEPHHGASLNCLADKDNGLGTQGDHSRNDCHPHACSVCNCLPPTVCHRIDKPIHWIFALPFSIQTGTPAFPERRKIPAGILLVLVSL